MQVIAFVYSVIMAPPLGQQADHCSMQNCSIVYSNTACGLSYDHDSFAIFLKYCTTSFDLFNPGRIKGGDLNSSPVAVGVKTTTAILH